MAVSVTDSASQISSNYEKYKDYFADKGKNELGQADFLALMVEQMKNQDFTNPTDNSEYIAQLAQFNTLQQMQEMVYSANATYATSLVGKIVTVANYDSHGEYAQVTDVVTGVRMNGKEFELTVGGKTYTTANIMEVHSEMPKKPEDKPEDKPEEKPEDKPAESPSEGEK